jgi:hypothetical protein
VKKGGEGVRLGTQRDGPGVVRKINNDHQIILITRNTEYRRSPHITVDKRGWVYRVCYTWASIGQRLPREGQSRLGVGSVVTDRAAAQRSGTVPAGRERWPGKNTFDI